MLIPARAPLVNFVDIGNLEIVWYPTAVKCGNSRRFEPLVHVRFEPIEDLGVHDMPIVRIE